MDFLAQMHLFVLRNVLRTALNASPHTNQQTTTLTKSSANNAVYQLKTRPAYQRTIDLAKNVR